MIRFVNYWKFIGKQLGHWQLPNYCLFFFGLGIELTVWLAMGKPINWITTLTFFGTILGQACICAISAGSSINGVLGLLSAICFIIIGYSAKNYLSIGMQCVYVCTLDLPILVYGLKWQKRLVNNIRGLHIKGWIVTILLTAFLAILSGLFIAKFTNDPRPITDSLSFSVATAGGLLTFLRYKESFVFWIIGSIFSITLWAITAKEGDASVGMLLNYCVYFINDIIGFTVSPWYNKHIRNRVLKENQKLYN